MIIFIIFAIIYLVLGLFALNGKALIADLYNNQPWTEEYKKELGKIYLIFSGSLFVAYAVIQFFQPPLFTGIFLMLILLVPSALLQRKCNKKYKNKIL